MNTKDIAKIFTNTLKDRFLKDGYDLSVSTDWFRIGAVLSKNGKKSHNKFRLLVEQLSDEKIILSYDIHISFIEIEKILRPILKKNELSGTDYDEVSDSFRVKNDLPSEKGIKIASEKDIVLVSDLFTKFFREDALPFFEHWHSLPVLYDYIKELPEEREVLGEVLGLFYQLKKAIIYRLCNDNLALEYIEKYYKRRKTIFENYPNEIVAERYYNASKELKEILEKTAPIYNTVM